MKRMKRGLSIILALVLVISLLPLSALTAKAGVFVGTIGTVEEGETATIRCYGASLYDLTNLIIQAPGNPVAVLTAYGSDGTETGVYHIEGDYSNIFYNLRGGSYFTLEVIHGTVTVSANGTFTKAPTIEKEDNHLENDCWAIGNINQVYLSAGDTAQYYISDLPPSKNDYFAAQASDYNAGSFRSGYYSEDPRVATVDENGVITAVGTGTTTIYMAYRFGFTSSTKAYFKISCQVQVVGDYGLAAAYENYYAEGNDKYFNIIDLNDPDASGFDIKVDEEVYNTGEDHQMMITFPEDYYGSVRFSKEGYLPQSLDMYHYGSYNWVTLHKETEDKPIIQSVLGRSANSDQWLNLKVQALNICEDVNENHIIDVDVYWGNLIPQSVWIENGSTVIPVIKGTTSATDLSRSISPEGKPTYVCARSVDGTVTKSQILINVVKPQKFLTTDFGDEGGLTATYTGPQDGLNQIPFSIKLGGNCSFEYAIDDDGNVKGTIGVKLAGLEASATGTAPFYEMIKETITEIKKTPVTNTQERERKGEELFNALERSDCDIEQGTAQFGFDANVALVGYAEGKLVNGKLDIQEVGVLCKVSVQASFSRQSLSFVVPHFWEIQVKAELEIPVVGVAPTGGKLKFTMPDIEFTIGFSGGIHLGFVQTKELADFGVVLDASLKIVIPTAGGFKESVGTVNSQIRVVASLGSFEINAGHFDLVKDYPLWGDVQKTVRSRSFTRALLREENYTQLQRYTGGNLLTHQQEEGYLLLASDVYLDSRPQLVQLEGKELMVWLVDKADRTAENRSCLYYAVYDQATQVWTDPQPVMDNGTADQSPRLAMIGETVYLVWSKAADLYEEGAALTDTAKALDLYAAAFDPDAGTFGEPVCISGENQVYDADPILLEVNGQPCVVWRQNSESDVFGRTGTNAILCAAYNGESWEQTLLAENLYSLNGLTAYVKDGTLQVVYAADTDGDYETTADIELFAICQGEITQLTDNEVADFGPVYDGQILYRHQEGALVSDAETIPLALGATGVNLLQSPDDRRLLVYQLRDEKMCTNLYAQWGDDLGWSEPVQITDLENRYITEFSLRFDGNDLVVTAVARQVGEDGELGQTDIIRCIKAVEDDLALTGATLNAYTLTANGMLVGTAQVTNPGMTTVKHITVTVSDLEGNTLSAGDYEQVLLPGQTGQVEFLCPVADLTGAPFRVSVHGRDLQDAQPENNAVELTVHPADASVENVIAQMDASGETEVTAFLVNRGLTALQDVELTFHKNSPNGELLGSVTVPNSELGTSQAVRLTTGALAEGDVVYVCAVLAEEENILANNADFTLVRQPQYQSLEEDTVEHTDKIDHTELLPGKEYNLDCGGDTQYASFTPDETGYYQLEIRLYKVGSYPSVSDLSVNMHDSDWNNTAPVFTKMEQDKTDYAYVASLKNVYYLQEQVNYEWSFYSWRDTTAQVILTKVEQNPPASMTLSHSQVTLAEGDTDPYGEIVQLTPIFEPEDSFTAVTYASSNETVVKVDPDGVLHPLCAGTAVVTATAVGSDLQAKCTVTVTPVQKTPIEGNKVYNSLYEGVYSFTPSKSGFHLVKLNEYAALYNDTWERLDLRSVISDLEDIYYFEAGKPVYIQVTSAFEDWETLCISRCPDLTLDTPGTVEIEEAYESSFFNFTPDQDWMYAFLSDSTQDPNADLYSMELEELASDDDGGEDGNFRLAWYLNTGKTYLLRAGLYRSFTGSYTVTMEKEEKFFTSMEISALPAQMDYVIGFVEDYFDDSGLKLRFTSNNGLVTDVDVEEDGTYLDGEWIDIDSSQIETTGEIVITYQHLRASFRVNLRENPVSGITLVKGTSHHYIEHLNGYETEIEDLETGEFIPMFHYYTYTSDVADALIRIDYTDGTSKTAAPGEQVDGYLVEWEDNQWDTPWILGTGNETTLTYLGYSCTLPVAVIENPVERIEIENNTVGPFPEEAYGEITERYNEETDSYEEFYYYYFDMPEDLTVRIHYTDGTSKVVAVGYDPVDGYYFDWDEDQYDLPWTLGNQNYVTISYMNRDVQLPVSVVENPVKSMRLLSAPTRIYEYGDSTFGSMSYYGYILEKLDLTGLKLEVEYKNGSKKIFTAADIQGEMLDGYPLKQNFSYYFFEPTTDTVMLDYLGKTVEFEITLQASPVTSLEILKGPDLGDYSWYLSPLVQGMQVKITYSNGKETVVTAGKDNVIFQNADQMITVDGYPLEFVASVMDTDAPPIMLLFYRGVRLDLSDWFRFADAMTESIQVQKAAPKGEGMILDALYSDGTTQRLEVKKVLYWSDAYEYGYGLTDQGILYYNLQANVENGVLTSYDLYTMDQHVEIPMVSGTRVSGKITAYGDSTPITVELWKDGGTAALYTVTTTDGSYSFDGVASGSYVLKISKRNHVTRSEPLTVETAPVIQNGKICLKGDVNGDGRVNIGDAARAYAHVKRTTMLDDEYAQLCADVTGDGRINIGDPARIYAHVKNTAKLW